MDTGENERKRLWENYQTELQQTAATFAAESNAEPVVFLCDVRDLMARKIADYFIDEEHGLGRVYFSSNEAVHFISDETNFRCGATR